MSNLNENYLFAMFKQATKALESSYLHFKLCNDLIEHL